MGAIGSDAELAIAVANAGGLGMLSGVGLVPAALEELCARTSERSAGPFGVNFLMPFLDRDAVVIAAKGAPLVEFFYGEPDPSLVESVHENRALAGWQVGSADEAAAAVRAGCDLLVAQGTEAGGHVRGELPLLELLKAVAARAT